MSYLRPDSFNKTDYNTFLKVRESLCLNGVQKDQELDLKKGFLQTIIKKQCYQKGYKFPSKRSQLLKDGVCGPRVEVKCSTFSFFGGSGELSSYASDRYRQVLLKQKTIQEVHADGPKRIPYGLLRTFGALRNLQTLVLALIPTEFMKFPRILESLGSLTNLYILIKKDELEKVEPNIFDGTLSHFSRHLASKKHLRDLQFDAQIQNLISTEETGTTLLSIIGDLNLKFFKIVLQVDEKILFNPLKIQKFLKQVELLNLIEGSYSGGVFPENKCLVLIGAQLPNFHETLVECASLKRLTFTPLLVKDNLPQSLGLAKDITELVMPIHFKTDDPTTLPNLDPILSEVSRLETLRLFPIELNNINLMITRSDPKIADHLRSIAFSNAPIWPSPTTFKDLFSQISKLQTLTSLYFDYEFMEDVMIWEIIFNNLVNLKKLYIRIRNIGSDVSDFPIESLGSLQSLEILNIECSVFDKIDVLSRFPKLSALKDVGIAKNFFTSILETDAYRKKYRD